MQQHQALLMGSLLLTCLVFIALGISERLSNTSTVIWILGFDGFVSFLGSTSPNHDIPMARRTPFLEIHFANLLSMAARSLSGSWLKSSSEANLPRICWEDHLEVIGESVNHG